MPNRSVSQKGLFRLEINTGDAGELFERGPFDLLVHDGGWGSGKADPRRVDPMLVLRDDGVMTIDDYAPITAWPPRFQGDIDLARLVWLTDDRPVSTEMNVATDTAVPICRRRPHKAARPAGHRWLPYMPG